MWFYDTNGFNLRSFKLIMEIYVKLLDCDEIISFHFIIKKNSFS